MADPLLDFQQLVANQIFNKSKKSAARALPTGRGQSLDANVPEGMVPPSEDFNYGRYFKPQPTLVQKLGGLFGGAGDPGIGPQALETPIIGAVLNPRNAGLIMNVLKKFLKANPQATEAELAKEFTLAKFPIFSKGAEIEILQPSADEQVNYLRNNLKLRGGYGLWSDQKVRLRDWGDEPANELVNTLTHELTHAKQHKKDPIGMNTSYQHPVDFSHEAYEDQWYERNARRGGETGQKAWDRFGKFFTPDPPNQLDLQTPVTKEFINENIMPAAARRLAAAAGKPGYDDIVYNLQWGLQKAAETAARGGKPRFPGYESPYNIANAIYDFISHGQEREDFYKKLAGNIYHGFKNPSPLAGVPEDMRTLQDFIKGMPNPYVGPDELPTPPILESFRKYRNKK